MRIQVLKNYRTTQQAIVKTFTTSNLVKREFGDCWRWADGDRKGKPCPVSVELKIMEALH